MMDPHHDRDFAARTNRDEVARLTAERDAAEAKLAGLEAVLDAQAANLWREADSTNRFVSENVKLRARVAELEAVIKHQSRRVRNYSAPDDVFMAIPVAAFGDEIPALAQGQGE